jgi:hypothetical protein
MLSEKTEGDAKSLSISRTSKNVPENRGAKAIPGINPRGEEFRRTTTKVAWSKNELENRAETT